jgi:hypothetical protein
VLRDPGFQAEQNIIFLATRLLPVTDQRYPTWKEFLQTKENNPPSRTREHYTAGFEPDSVNYSRN